MGLLLARFQLLQADGGQRIELVDLLLLEMTDGVAPLPCFNELGQGL